MKTIQDILMNITKNCFKKCVKEYSNDSINEEEEKCMVVCCKKYLEHSKKCTENFQKINFEK
jgi:mitochondrial import inner membrane translocase subunit TIM9